MQVKTSYILWGVILLAVVGNGDRIAGTVETSQQSVALKSESGADRSLFRQQAREAQKLSKIALDRAKAGCIPIVDLETGKDYYFNAGDPMLDSATGLPLQEGFACNRLGLTGVIVDGVVTDLVMVGPDHKVEYLGYLSLQQGGQ